jgi:hydroxymethylbilane synthase
LGYKTEIVAVKAQGDLILDKPLYELGITGIFTKTLDIAMINGQVDIAVHSMKDVPLHCLVLFKCSSGKSNNPRYSTQGNVDFLNELGIIATGSLRRQAQWLNKYQHIKQLTYVVT